MDPQAAGTRGVRGRGARGAGKPRPKPARGTRGAGKPRPKPARGTTIHESRFATPLGALAIFWSRAGVCALVFAGGRAAARARLLRRGAPVPRRAPLPPPVGRALTAYFRGRIRALDAVALDLGGTAFQRRVWNALRAIPPGRPLSYRALAQALGTPRGARAVGRAAATNPVSLIVPCHRLVGSDGSLTGFMWGVERKRRLLAHEAAHATEDGWTGSRARGARNRGSAQTSGAGGGRRVRLRPVPAAASSAASSAGARSRRSSSPH